MASGEALDGDSASGMNPHLAIRATTLRLGSCTLPQPNLQNRRIRDPYVRWYGRGEAMRPLLIPVGVGSMIMQVVNSMLMANGGRRSRAFP